MTKRTVIFFLLLATALCTICPYARALPEGGVVTGGVAGIQSGADRMDVLQGTDRAVIDWRGFDVGSHEIVQFHQPLVSSATLNRVTGGLGASQIMGRVQANGTVIITNPDGMVFGPAASVDVGSLVATSASMAADDFMGGSNVFDIPSGNLQAAVINNGAITVKDTGLAALVAPQAINNGIITARQGTVHLASGTTVALDLAGDGLLKIATPHDHLPVATAINNGTITAPGGTIALTAAAARQSVDALVANTGTLSATSVHRRNGRVILQAEGANGTARTGQSAAAQTGIIDARGVESGDKGGSVHILADSVGVLAGSIIDASGMAGGGDIRIGGDYLGTGDTQRAMYTMVEENAFIRADSEQQGDGGRIIVWADDTTYFAGTILARGGQLGGDGGFVETSGKLSLSASGLVDLTAPLGNKGTYLLDPATIAIYGNVDPRFQSTDLSVNLQAALRYWNDGGDPSTVTLTYSNDALAGAQINGTAGAATVATTTNINLTSVVVAGARIRLGNVNGQTALANDAGNTDTYTVQSISYTAGVGTTITLTSALTANYNGGAGNNTVYRGLVSQWSDKSGNNYHTSNAAASGMPLWVSTAQNGKGGLRFDGADRLVSVAGGYPVNQDYTVGTIVNQISAATGNVLSGNNAGHAFYFAGTQRICMFSGSCFATSSTNLPYGTPGILGGTFVHATRVGNIYQNNVNVATGVAGASNTMNIFNLGSYGAGNYYNGFIFETYLYNTALTATQRALVDQYESAKWNIALDPNSGTALTEHAEATHVTTGFSVFASDYLERLSSFADISLQATGNITLDLKGDTLALTGGRSLSLTTTGGTIANTSAGTIQTTGGGGIAFSAAGGITLDNFTLNAQGGIVDLISGGTVTYVSPDAINVRNVTGSSINLRSTLPGSDLRVGGVITTSGTATLASTGNLIIPGGNAAAALSGPGRILTYSVSPERDAVGGLSPAFRRFGCIFGGGCADFPSAGNGFFYSGAAPPFTDQTAVAVALPSTYRAVSADPARLIMAETLEASTVARSDIKTTLQPLPSDGTHAADGSLASLSIDPWLTEYYGLQGQ